MHQKYTWSIKEMYGHSGYRGDDLKPFAEALFKTASDF